MRMSEKSKRNLAIIALFLSSIIWGLAFVVMKSAVQAVPPNYLLGIRFGVAGLILLIVMRKKLRTISKSTLIHGIIVGVLLYSAFAMQTIGLQYTSAGKNAFITTIYVVLVPFCTWLLKKQKPSGITFIAATVCLIGIGILSLNPADAAGINIGDALTLFCGIIFAWHIAVVDGFTAKGDDVMIITMLQFLTAAVLGFACGGIFEEFPSSIGTSTLLELAYISILSTLVALTLQNVGVKYISGSAASLILGCEALFGCLAGIVFLNEEFSLRIVIGGALIFGSMIVSELMGRKKAES